LSRALVDGAPILLAATLVLAGLKRPVGRGVETAVDFFAWALVVASIAVLALEVAGVLPSFYSANGGVFSDLAEFDNANHWLPLTGLLSLDGRWGGLAQDPNAAGPIGACLIVYGLTRPGIRRVTWVASGVLMLVLTDSRTAYVAAAAGLFVLAVLPRWSGQGRVSWPARTVAASLAALAALRILLSLRADPGGTVTATGRVTMWPDFLSLLQQSPLFGVGDAGIAKAVANGTLAPWSFQGHSVYVDTLVRYGILGLLLVLLVLGLALVITVRSALQGASRGLAVLTVLLMVSLTEASLPWLRPTVSAWLLLVAVLLAASGGYLRAAESSSVATSTTSTPSAAPSD
jgi:O-antigen ligase